MFVDLLKVSHTTTSDITHASADDHLNVKDSWLDLWKCLWDSTVD